MARLTSDVSNFSPMTQRNSQQILVLRCTHAPDVPEHTFSVTCNTAVRFTTGGTAVFKQILNDKILKDVFSLTKNFNVV